MAVHPQSVIPASVQTYDPEFYTALTDKEEFCYGQNLAYYQPFFQNLANAITGYFAGAFTTETFYTLLNSTMYSFLLLNAQYGVGEALKTDLPSIKVFDMAGLRDLMLSRPVDYYDDLYVETDPVTLAETVHAPRLETDTEIVSTDAVSAAHTNAQSLTNALKDVVQQQVGKLLFLPVFPQAQVDAKDFVPPATPYLVQIGAAPSKAAMYDLIYGTYGYGTHLELFGIAGVDPMA